MKSRMKIKQTQFERQSQQKRGIASCPTGLPVFKNFKIVLLIAVMLLLISFTSASEVTDAITKGNRLYAEGDYTAAADEYTRAIEVDQSLLAAKFNKGNSEYRLGEIDDAIDAYKEVAARSKDDELIAKAKYNIGRSYFKKAAQAEQASQAAQKAGGQSSINLADQIDNYRAAVKSLRQTLDIDPDNQKAKRNIEIAKRKLKKLKEKQKQQQKQDQQQDKNKDQNQESQNPEQEKKNSQNDDNKKQDQQQNEDQNPQDKQEQQQQQNPDEQKQQQSGKEDKKQDPLDKLADQILKKEEKDKEKRRILMLRQIPVEKDW